MSTPTNLSEVARKKGQMRPVLLTKRDSLRVAAGATLRAIPVSNKKLAYATGVDESLVSHQKAGRKPSALSRIMEEAYRMERAGISSAYFVATLNACAMYPELERLSTEELEDLLRDTLRDETRANSRCNDLDADVLAGEPVSLEALRAEHMRQAAKSERVMAICDLLAERRR